MLKKLIMIEENKIKIDEGKRRIGKDEMNLIELPFTLLTKRNPKGLKTIERHWLGKGEDGKERKFNKIITGSDKWGLPTFIGEEVYLACMELSYRQGFENRKVSTSQYDLIKLMNWPTGGSSYQRLIKAFNQLGGIWITTNAFWDNQNKRYQKLGFGLIDDYCFFEDEKKGQKSNYHQLSIPLGYFHWNETFFSQSIKKNNIKTIDTSLYFSLNGYTTKRLYRFVDKKLYNQQSFEIDLFRLAFEKMEMTGNYKYPSKVIEKLKPAMEELKKRGIAESQIKKSKTESGYKICFSPATKHQVLLGKEKKTENPPKAEDLANYFHKKLDPQKIHIATEKELQQAQDLLNEYGEGKSKQIIDYSVKQAQETKFKMQFLGAILNYIPQAIESFKQKEQKQLQQKAQAQEQRKIEELQFAYYEYKKSEMENYKNSISKDQYQKELEDVKQDYIEKYPWIKTKHWESSTLQGTAEANYKDWLIEKNKIQILTFEDWKKEREKDSAIAVK